VGIAPTEDQHLSTAHTRSDPAQPGPRGARFVGLSIEEDNYFVEWESDSLTESWGFSADCIDEWAIAKAIVKVIDLDKLSPARRRRILAKSKRDGRCRGAVWIGDLNRKVSGRTLYKLERKAHVNPPTESRSFGPDQFRTDWYYRQ